MKVSKKIAAIFAALAISTAGSALAAPVALDFAGVGQQVAALDWNPGNALAQGAIPLSQDPNAPTSFDLYYHAALGNFINSNGTQIAGTGLGQDYEITTVLRFGELGVRSIGAGAENANFTFNPAADTFVKFYKDAAVDSNNLAGTGFNNGNEFLSGTVAGVLSSNFGIPNNPLQVELLDQFLADNWGGQLTVVGTGSTSLLIKVAEINKDEVVITTPINFDFFVFNVNLNTTNNLPFSETNPSQLFWDGAGFIAPVLGDVNGLNGPDIIFQADGNSSFALAQIPEPSTLVLSGLGLLIAGGLLRRRVK